MGRKFHRDAAGGADALAHAMRQFQVVAVARRQVVAGLRDADDGFAGLQFFPGEAIIEVALEIERGHARIMRVVEPFAGSEFAAFAVAGLVVPVGAFFHCVPPALQTRKTRSGS